MKKLGQDAPSKEEILQRQIQDLQRKLESIENKLQEHDPREGNSATFLGRLASVFAEDPAEADRDEEDTQSQHSVASRLSETKTIHIRQVQLTLNGRPIDDIGTQFFYPFQNMPS